LKPLIDLHVHTLASGHAFSTLKENIEEAKAKGLKVLGISEHAKTMGGAPHLYYFHNLKVFKKEIMGVRILKGIEANILDFQGNIDVEDELALRLDYLIASLHPACIRSGTIDENTHAIMNVMNNPYVKIIGHPDDSRFPLDYNKIVRKAAEKSVVLEVNNSSLSDRTERKNARENQISYLNLCKKYGVKVMLGSDAHIWYNVGDFANALQIMDDLKFPPELILNYDLDLLKYIFF
jgi:putative hydrolase